MRARAATSILFASMLCALPARAAQSSKGDPLTEGQTDQIRELGNQPVERLKLYLKFIEERIGTIRELSSDAGENNRPVQLRAKYEEFTRLVDELADNMDTYTADHADVRKALRSVLEASAKWPGVLSKPPTNPTYEFARKTSLDAALSITDDTRHMLDEQEKYFAAHKGEANRNGKAPSAPE